MFTALNQQAVTDVLCCARWEMLVISSHSLVVSVNWALHLYWGGHICPKQAAPDPWCSNCLSSILEVIWIHPDQALHGELTLLLSREMFPLIFLQVLYEDSQMVTLTAPYIAGFLAFRETPFLLDALQRLERNQPHLLPQVLILSKCLLS